MNRLDKPAENRSHDRNSGGNFCHGRDRRNLRFPGIGINDLTQLMLGTDRNLTDTANDISFMHPAVLNAVSEVVKAGKKRHCSVSVCGEAAGEPDFACLLVGLGIRESSASPNLSCARSVMPYAKLVATRPMTNCSILPSLPDSGAC